MNRLLISLLCLAIATSFTAPVLAATPCDVTTTGTVVAPTGSTLWASVENPGIQPITLDEETELTFVAYCQDEKGSWYIVEYKGYLYTVRI